MATAQATGITLQGSVKTVTEFFEYSINNILYQREIYPPETFRRVARYGLAMFVTTDDALTGYLSNVLSQLKGGPLPRHRPLAFTPIHFFFVPRALAPQSGLRTAWCRSWYW